MPIDTGRMDEHLPSILTKDDFITNLMLNEVKSIRRDMDDLKNTIHDHCKNFNDFKVDMAPFLKLDIVALNKMLAINPEHINSAINSTNVLNSLNRIVLPILLVIVLGLTFLGLREYMNHENASIKLPSPPSVTNSSFAEEEDLWEYIRRT